MLQISITDLRALARKSCWNFFPSGEEVSSISARTCLPMELCSARQLMTASRMYRGLIIRQSPISVSGRVSSVMASAPSFFLLPPQAGHKTSSLLFCPAEKILPHLLQKKNVMKICPAVVPAGVLPVTEYLLWRGSRFHGDQIPLHCGRLWQNL